MKMFLLVVWLLIGSSVAVSAQVPDGVFGLKFGSTMTTVKGTLRAKGMNLESTDGNGVANFSGGSFDQLPLERAQTGYYSDHLWVVMLDFGHIYEPTLSQYFESMKVNISEKYPQADFDNNANSPRLELSDPSALDILNRKDTWRFPNNRYIELIIDLRDHLYLEYGDLSFRPAEKPITNSSDF